jgi:hypothetical protein
MSHETAPRGGLAAANRRPQSPQIGSRAGAAEEHLARIKRIQELKGIVDVAFQMLVLAAVSDAGAAAPWPTTMLNGKRAFLLC